MRYTDGFLREAPTGKLVGVLKYKGATGQWRQVTKTFTRDRGESERMLAQWRARMEGGPRAGGPRGSEAAAGPR